MARHSDDALPVHHLAVGAMVVGFFALGVVRHYGYYILPNEQRGPAWVATGAVVMAALVIALVAIWRNGWQTKIRNRWVMMIAVWWVAEEAMAAGCNVWYILDPWPKEPSEDLCSSLLHFDLGKVGAAVVALIMLAIPARVYRMTG